MWERTVFGERTLDLFAVQTAAFGIWKRTVLRASVFMRSFSVTGV
jgi:hypothetical protein